MQWSLVLLFLMGQCCFITCQLFEYHYVGEEKNWTEAQQYCREKHTDLATVSNMKDMKRLNQSSKTDAWIGLYNQTGGNRKWLWSLPGVEFNESETKWHSGEPTDRGTGTENCGITWKDLTWGDHSCGPSKRFICYDERNSSQKFYFINETKSWLGAQSFCREKHTDLISGLEQLQDQQLNNLLSSAGGDEYIYIGLFRDTWRWSDGSSFSFRHWSLNFDDQHYNPGQCAVTVLNDGGRWKNVDCKNKKPFFCYHDKVILIKENKTWEEALCYCRVHHHDLVTITNLDDQRWVQEKVKNASTPFVWIGLYYSCSQGSWLWVSDDEEGCHKNPFKNWSSDKETDGHDKCGAMKTGGQHQWFKKNYTEKFNFMCSKC